MKIRTSLPPALMSLRWVDGNQRVYLDLDDKNNFEKFEIIDR